MLPKSSYCIPALVAKSLPYPADGSISLGEERVLTTEHGFALRAQILNGEEELIKSYVEDAQLKICGVGVQEDDVFIVLSREPAEGDILITHEQTGTEKPESEKYPSIVTDATRALKKFAEHTGLKLRMHFRENKICLPLTEGDASTYHFVVGASPPGEVTSTERRQSCGVRLDPDGYYVRSNGPTKGRGALIDDEDGEWMAQAIERTIYLFVPKITRKTSVLLSSEGGDLLHKMLQNISKTLAKGIVEPAEVVLESPESYLEYAEARIADEVEMLRGVVEDKNTTMANALETYRQAIQSRRFFVGAIAHIESQILGPYREQANKEWKRFTSNPLVDKVSVNSDGLHVKTRRIIAEHEGKHYNFGTFMIRLRLGGQVSVWALESLHPRGIAHPHISDRSTFCYGNAGIAIDTAAIELRFADAIELVIEWLQRGYDPTLADVRIDEWQEWKEAA